MYYCPSLQIAAARYLSIFTVNPVSHLLCCQAAFLTFSLIFFFFCKKRGQTQKVIIQLGNKAGKSSLIYQKEPKIYDNVQGMTRIKEGDATFTQVLQMTDWPRSSIMLETKTSKQ